MRVHDTLSGVAETPARPADPSPSRPPRPSDESELGFVRRPMVRWFDPHQLVDTAVRVLVSGVFSSYADSREMQAREPAEVPDRTGDAEFWLDYVADLGDGWNSTYNIASLLAAERLEVRSQDGETHATERGRILVMGGDQVYPVPKAVEYENRMLGPYRAALPCARGEAPELFAIPGTHDWYDGAVNFTSIFCRNRSIGGWLTRQRRSYFAVRLPAGWWLWGIDIQFGACVDEVQLQYFADVAREQVQPGDRIVLCMSKEVKSGRKRGEIHSDRDIAHLEREIIEPSGARVLLYLKSGKHYYSRYEEQDGPRHHIESGGGGAFLHPTHNLPERIDLQGARGATPYRQARTYPSAHVSRRLRKRIWLVPAYNTPLAAVFGAVQVLLAFMLGLHLDDRHVSLGVGDLLSAMWESPTAFLLSLLVLAALAGLVRFAHDATGIARLLLGLAHLALHVASVVAIMLAASHLSTSGGLDGSASLLAFLGLVFLLGGISGMFAMTSYLWLTGFLGLHGTEGYAPLHHQDLKHFLRLHITADGVLTVYPIALDRVGRKWTLRPDAPADAPWFAPDGPALRPRLVEEPIRIGRPAASADREPAASSTAS